MIRLLRNSMFILLIAMTACKNRSILSTLPFINKPDFTPEWIDKNNSSYDSIHTIPPFAFINQNGETVTEKTVAGKIYVANFIFTRCGGICPKMTDNMSILQQKFKDDPAVIFLSHSVTPDMDSVPVLKKYAADKGIISGKWHLLTGDKNQIYALAKKQYYAGDTIGYYQTGNQFLHTENFILLDKHRRIRGVYNGTLALEMDRLADDIYTLKQEE
ncbi:SCO family protein [Ferruginibacter lapsinanis]|uniref:SCO family protein n=1 Tax=Ferruginibacter lapsinanis TaxID=563172 RepID=UPI001E325F0F|nr:SCO family protein [Ferruginibacter lapsinanis]UEG49420.1 SCO family protein [Ferruginibacter lapsinanis]